MIKRGIIPILSFGHGINDMLAGYFLGCIAKQSTDLVQAGLTLFIYNVLAFGGQYPVALWLEKFSNKKPFLIAAYGLNTGAAVLFFINPSVSVVLAGLASAIYHVTGGSVCAAGNKAINIGIFAAPGVAGLVAGGYCAWTGYNLTPALLIITMLFLLLLLRLQIKNIVAAKQPCKNLISVIPDRHDVVMILLLTVISLRSAVWNIFQLLHENNYEWLVAIAIAAFAGKIVGGWLADRVGWRLYTFVSLITATPLLTFFREELLLFCVGIGLLQSGIPATTAVLIHSVNGKTERGIGLSFGTAIIAGGIIFTFPQEIFAHQVIIPAAIILAALLLFYYASRKGAFARYFR